MILGLPVKRQESCRGGSDSDELFSMGRECYFNSRKDFDFAGVESKINERRKQHSESSRRDIIKSFKLIYACDDELIAFYLQRVRCESIMQG